MIEAPQGFVVAEECRKAASQNGYRRDLGEEAGWARYGSTTAKGTIRLAAAGSTGPWFLALDHPGVVEELEHPRSDMTGPGLAFYAFATLAELYTVLPKVYALGLTLPEGPLEDFRSKTRDLPKSTETERLVVQRIGQDIFRDSLMTYWQGHCPLTGITDSGPAPCLAHRPVEGLPQRRRAAEHPQRLASLRALGRRLRQRPRDLRRRRPACLLPRPERPRTHRATLAPPHPAHGQAPPTPRPAPRQALREGCRVTALRHPPLRATTM